MKKILLVCCSGMSTSLLVTKMNDAAAKKGLEAKIFAVSETEANKHFDEIDVLLLGPQVRYLLGKLQKNLEERGVPVAVIDSVNYGTMNGEAVLEQAINLMKA
ncbi:lactose/cellobiose PTS transporter subunit IIB [Alkaliphilus crotonatoxidans]